MKSMLTPSAATSRATTPNASAVIGRPSTTMVWVDGSRMHRQVVAALDGDVQADAADGRLDLVAQRRAVRRLPAGPATSTPSVSRPRITTCSTLSSSTLCRDSTSNSADVTPGLIVSGDGDQHRHLAVTYSPPTAAA